MKGHLARSHPIGADNAFTIELPNRISAVEEGRLALLDYLHKLGTDDRTVNRIEVILEEIVSNVVRHSTGASVIRIAAEISPGAIKLEFEDDGGPFDPLQAPEPDAFSTLAEAQLGGQGIPLVRRLSRSVTYERVGAMNRVTSLVALS